MLDNVVFGSVARGVCAVLLRIVPQCLPRVLSLVQLTPRQRSNMGLVALQFSTWRTADTRKTAPDDRPTFANLAVMADALPAAFNGIALDVGSVIIRLSPLVFECHGVFAHRPAEQTARMQLLK
jgi:hypothetical protein